MSTVVRLISLVMAFVLLAPVAAVAAPASDPVAAGAPHCACALIDPGDSRQMNGFTYANSNPITYSDPTGLFPTRTDGEWEHPSQLPIPDSSGPSRSTPSPTPSPAPVPSPVSEAAAEYAAATNHEKAVKAKLVETAKELGKILLDELGITAGLDCLQTGTAGSCAETALNVMTSVGAGFAIKIVRKYGSPRRMRHGISVGKRVASLVGDTVEGLWDWKAAGKKVQATSDKLGAAKAAAPACKFNSFTGVTLVLMADDSKKPIKNVEIGDKVMAADPATGETGPRKVVDLIRHGGLHTMVAVRLVDGTTIDATDRHPFWVQSRGEWTDAIDLKPADVVVSADGDLLAVESVRISEQDLTAYNLTVAGLHTYHVSASEVLVHNDGESPVGTIFRDGRYSFQIYSNDHGPAHGHLRGPGIPSGGIQLGQNGKPLDPNINLSSTQRDVVDRNRSAIRKSISKYMQWYSQNGPC